MKMANISSRENFDFISRLPDPILHHILGLLKTKKAVQTCVLSKRWGRLWTSLPFLKFNFEEDLDDVFETITESEDEDLQVVNESIAASRRFAKFVNTLLLRRKPLNLDVFRLSCHELDPDYATYERDWVCYAVNHNTRVLHLSLYDAVPCCLYTCTSLEELYLDINHTDLSARIVNLPNLRALSIRYADLNSNYVKNLLSGCTILEFLRIDSCTFIDCVIAHECLKFLTIVSCWTNGTGLCINTPNLLSFFYEGELLLLQITTLKMPSLMYACLVSCDSMTNTSLEGLATCLRFLANVEFLELHFKCGRRQELPAAVKPLKLPTFQKLEIVAVSFCMFSCFQVVTWILNSSPNLKELTILQREGCIFEEETSTNQLTEASSTVAVSLSKKLEKVEVKYWIYDQMVRQMIDTLMDGTNELENLKFRLSKYKNSKQYLHNVWVELPHLMP